jgi:hypothetical protein
MWGMLNSGFAIATIVGAVLSQSAAGIPPRIGDIARRLTDQDVADISNLATTPAQKAWLLIGPRGQVSDLEAIEAYWPASLSAGEVRWGPVSTVVRGSAKALAASGIKPTLSVERGWMLISVDSYAQVAVRGRSFDDVVCDQDTNRPFVVAGHFSDEELVSLVRFLRSGPSGPSSSAGSPGMAVHRDWPILRVSRGSSFVDVRLRGDDFTAQEVRLRSEGTGWLILSVSTVFK